MSMLIERVLVQSEYRGESQPGRGNARLETVFGQRRSEMRLVLPSLEQPANQRDVPDRRTVALSPLLVLTSQEEECLDIRMANLRNY